MLHGTLGTLSDGHSFKQPPFSLGSLLPALGAFLPAWEELKEPKNGLMGSHRKKKTVAPASCSASCWSSHSFRRASSLKGSASLCALLGTDAQRCKTPEVNKGSQEQETD